MPPRLSLPRARTPRPLPRCAHRRLRRCPPTAPRSSSADRPRLGPRRPGTRRLRTRRPPQGPASGSATRRRRRSRWRSSSRRFRPLRQKQRVRRARRALPGPVACPSRHLPWRALASTRRRARVDTSTRPTRAPTPPPPPRGGGPMRGLPLIPARNLSRLASSSPLSVRRLLLRRR